MLTILRHSAVGDTVNLVTGEGIPDANTEHWPDAITQLWLDQATDLLMPDIAHARSEDFDASQTTARFSMAWRIFISSPKKIYAVPSAPLASPFAVEGSAACDR